MSCEYSRFVRDKATSGMSPDQIAAGYAEQWGISYELAKQRMAEPKYQQEIEAGRMSGLGMIWAKLYTLAVDKNDHGILLLLAKERLNLFGKVDSEELLAKSSLSKEQLKAAHDIIFAK